MDRAELLESIRARLAEAHGDRLVSVVLYGSEARGDAGADSDIDVLVVLRGPIHLWADIRKSIDAVYPLVLDLGRPIHTKPVDIVDFEAGEFPLYRRAKAEGIVA